MKSAIPGQQCPVSNRLSKSELFGLLPPVWPEDLLPQMRQAVARSKRKIVVLDDDPTGTQTVHGVPVLTTWTVEALSEELANDLPCFYVLTNSRAFPVEEAVRINREVGRNLTTASMRQPGRRDFVVISRSDSTLRGHFPAEVDALGVALSFGGGSSPRSGRAHLPPVLLVPYFEAGGRYTVDDIHYVAEGDELVPAAETPFARDAVFGYRNSDLRMWVEEKTGGTVPAFAVASISLNDIRTGGPEVVRAKLLSLQDGQICVVNSAAPRDLEVVAWAALQAEDHGSRILYRTAAQFVAARLGLESRPLLTTAELKLGNKHGGLTVVGSYVSKTTEQLKPLLNDDRCERIELPVNALLSEDSARVVSDSAQRMNQALTAGRDVVMFTSRELIVGESPADNLEISRRVSAALVEFVQRLAVLPRFFVAKGGITSSDLATRGLGVKRALVLGQILPGVPVWELGPETKFPGLPYVVFPGNVGGPDALAELIQKLKH